MAAMSIRYEIHEAEAHLSHLVDQVEKGEDVVFCRSGRPVARLGPYVPTNGRKGGQWNGLVRIRDDFDEPLPPDTEQAFLGDAE